MKPKIDLRIDKTSVTEGDVVEFSWTCNPAEQVQLTMDNGYKTNTIDVEANGSKKFRLNRSKGKTQIVIGVTNGGKTYYKSVGVRVKKMKATKAEYVNDYTGAKGVKNNGLKNTWLNFKEKMKLAWNYQTPEKKLAYKILLALCGYMLLAAFIPRFSHIGLLIIMGFLFWTIFKKR